MSKLTTINIVTKIPAFLIGEKIIERIEINKIGFAGYCAAGDNAAALGGDTKKITNSIFRERIKLQCRAFDASGAVVELNDAAILEIPLKHALAIKEALGSNDGNTAGADGKPSVCKMLHKGDGMLTPIHISLGAPIVSGNDKVIAELEFTARNLGDLEDFVSADNGLERTAALLKIATPIGEGLTISVLPSWAIDQISLEDGIWIMNNVVPTFLFQPEASTETP